MTDEELIRKAQKVDYESFEAVVLKLKDKAYHIAYSYLRDETDSMDAVCSAVEKTLVNLKKLKEPKYFATWFIRIVINECKALMRKRYGFVRLADTLFDASMILGSKRAAIERELMIEDFITV